MPSTYAPPLPFSQTTSSATLILTSRHSHDYDDDNLKNGHITLQFFISPKLMLVILHFTIYSLTILYIECIAAKICCRSYFLICVRSCRSIALANIVLFQREREKDVNTILENSPSEFQKRKQTSFLISMSHFV